MACGKSTTKKTTKKQTRRVLKFSPNAKLNYVLKDIYEDIKEHTKEWPDFVKEHRKNYPRDSDYSIVRNGNLRIYYDDIRDLYKKAGYSKSTIERMSDDKIWETYCRQVGYVARNYF